MSSHAIVPTVAAWLATYLLHSTALILLTALVTLRVRDDGWRDTFWKLALTGGILSATLQVAFQLRPAGGRLAISSAPAPAVPQKEEPAQLQAPISAQRSVREQSSAPSASSASSSFQKPELDQRPSTSQPAPIQNEPTATRFEITQLLVIAWATIAMLLLLRLVHRHIRLYRMLADRRQVVEGGLAEMLAELRRNAGIWRPVWLAASPTCPTPLALGANEICVPERFVAELSRDEQRAALAHELAHIARRDPLWHLVAGVLESVLFFQPLNRLARVRMRESAEHLCDDWAVSHVGSEMGLARCLAAVASWIAPGADPVPTGTMAMAEGGSPLLVRVQRLLDRGPRGSAAPLLARVATVALLLATLTGAAPVFVPWSVENQVPAVAVDPDTTRITADRDSTPSPSPSASVSPSARVRNESLTVYRAPKGTDFARSFSWAREDARRRGISRYWIAWAVPGVVTRGETFVIDSRGLDMRDFSEGAIAEQLDVTAETDPMRATAPAVIVMLQPYVPENGIMQIAGVSARSPAAGMRIDKPVYWLGTPPVGASLDLLRDYIGTVGERHRLGETMVQAVAVHRDASVVPYLTGLIENDRAEHLHLRAIEGLQWHPTDANLALLVKIARDEQNPWMQRNAVEAIGDMKHPRAAATLRTLVDEIDNEMVRKQAVESMGEQPDTATWHTLVTIAETDGDPDVRRQAAEALGELPPREAMQGLRQIIWNSDKRDVQVEAVESLSDVGTRDALNLVMEIIEKHPSLRVKIEAIETLAEFGREWAEPRLIDLSRNHQDVRVRLKATEELGDLNRRTPDGNWDPNPNPNLNPGNTDPGNINPGNFNPGNFRGGKSSAKQPAATPKPIQ